MSRDAGGGCACIHHVGAPYFGEIHPYQRDPHDAVKQHEGARANAREIDQHSEQNRQSKSTETTRESDDAGDRADVVWEFVADVFESARLAEREGDTKHEHQYREP